MWEETTALTMNLPSCSRPEFKYTTAEELQGLPYTAKVDAYTGGGYVYRLNAPAKQIREDLLELQRDHWVNNHTRAVFLELSAYNANVSQLIESRDIIIIIILIAQLFLEAAEAKIPYYS